MENNALQNILTEMVNIKNSTVKNMGEFVASVNKNQILKESLFNEDEDEESQMGMEGEDDDMPIGDTDDAMDVDGDESEESEMQTGDDEESQMEMGDSEGFDTEAPEGLEGEEGMEDDGESDPFSDYYDDEGHVDLVLLSQTDPQKVADLIKMAPDGATFVKVSVPALEMEVPTETDFQDEPEETEEMDDMDDQQEVEDVVDESDHMDKINENKRLNKKVLVYEGKLRKLQSLLKENDQARKKLLKEKNEMFAVIKEAKPLMEQQHLINTNLKNMSILMANNNLTIKERNELITDFNKVKSLNESEITLNMWKKMLLKESRTPLKEQILENNSKDGKKMLGVEIEKNKGIVTESVNKIDQGRIDTRFETLSGSNNI
jgi:hypothetical protein